MDPPEPVPGTADGLLLDDFSAAAIGALVDAAGPGTDSPLLSIEVRHLGGAAGRADPEHRRPRRDRRPIRAVRGGDGRSPGDEAGCLPAPRSGARRAGAMGRRPIHELHRAHGQHKPGCSTTTSTAACARSSRGTTPTTSSRRTTRSHRASSTIARGVARRAWSSLLRLRASGPLRVMRFHDGVAEQLARFSPDSRLGSVDG